MDDKNAQEFESNFSVLDRYGTNVTEDAFVTNPAIGRDKEIKELILVLLTPEKSAILIGKPGIGKTAIVEGLAYRIQKGDVPDALKGYTILNIKTASLLGTMPNGESKVQKMIDELKTREKVILFIDEIHMLIGSTETSSLDFANIFKEGLGRGSIKVIGATTTEEYERYILRDKAFTRRFQKIEVLEPNREETIKIMMGTLPKFEIQTNRKMKYTPFIKERIMGFLVDITSEYKRVYALGSRYPDVCLTLLKQAFSYTVYDDREYMDIFDIRKAIENSKNIYPDVIKKSLPEFDKMFDDLIKEEKGEKEVEEWRREEGRPRFEEERKNNEKENAPSLNNSSNNNDNVNDNDNANSNDIGSNNVVGNVSSVSVKNIDFNRKANTNARQMNLSNKENVQSIIANFGFENKDRRRKNEDDPFRMFEKGPKEILNKKKIRDREPVKSILGNTFNKFASVGNTSTSTGFNNKLAASKDAEKLDNILLSGELEVMTKSNKNALPNINFRVTNELKRGGTVKPLLDNSIASISEERNRKSEYRPQKYKQGGGYNSDNLRNQNLMIDNYNNFDLNSMGNNQDDDFRSQWVQRRENNNRNNYNNYNRGPRRSYFDPMNDENINYQNNNNNNFDNNYNDRNYMNNGGNRNMTNNYERGMNGFNNNFDMNNDFNQPFDNGPTGKFFDNNNSNNNERENLFGAPMYSDDNDVNNQRNNSYVDRAYSNNNNINNYNNVNNNYNNYDNYDNISNSSNNNNNSFLGANNSGNDNSSYNSNKIDFLMGNSKLDNSPSKNVDIYGKLIDTDNDMTIRNGRIMENFSSKYDAVNDRFTRNDENVNLALESFGSGQNYNTRNMNNNFNNPNVARANTFNELKVDKKVIDTDFDNQDFVNINDLNSGRIRNEDTNRYISSVNDTNVKKNNYNLDLESSNNKKDEYYDDFYD